MIRSTIQVDGIYPSARSSAVPCGWDTNEILKGLGFSENEISTFTTEKAAQIYEKR